MDIEQSKKKKKKWGVGGFKYCLLRIQGRHLNQELSIFLMENTSSDNTFPRQFGLILLQSSFYGELRWCLSQRYRKENDAQAQLAPDRSSWGHVSALIHIGDTWSLMHRGD